MADIWTNKRKNLRILLSAVTLVGFLSSLVFQPAWSAVDEGDLIYEAFISKTAPFASLDPGTFTVPAHLGAVKYTHKGPSDKFIVHVQDAHCNFFAQHKISDIIDYLNEEYGMHVINLEGGSGDYDLAVFTSISGETIRREVAEYFVKKGELNGAEFYAINNPDKVKLWGIEDTDLYLANLQVYRDSLSYKKDVDKYLAELTHILNNLKRHIYSQELLQVDIAYNTYKAGNMDFQKYLQFVIDRAKRRNIDIEKFRNVYLLADAMDMEKDIDFARANKERSMLIDEFHKRFSKNEMKELVAETVKFKTKRSSRKTFYVYLLAKTEQLNLDAENYPALTNYVEYITTYEAVDQSKVMAELDALENEIKQTLYRNPGERTLNKLSRNLALLKNIFNMTLTKTDYQYYQENAPSFDMHNYLRFIEKEASKHRIAARPDSGITKLDEYRARIMKFYEYSFKRDEVFLKNLRFQTTDYRPQTTDREQATSDKRQATVLITGGFHTENLCELFKKEGISYVSVMPKFVSAKGYENPYFELLAGQTTDIQRMLSSVLAKAAMIQVASMLSTDLAKKVWSDIGVAAFHNEVVIREMLRAWAALHPEGCEITVKDGDRELFTVSEGARPSENHIDMDISLIRDIAQDIYIDPQIKEAIDQGFYLDIREDDENRTAAIDFLEAKAGELERSGYTDAAEQLKKIAAELKDVPIKMLTRGIEGFKGHAGGRGIYINLRAMKSPKDTVATIIHEATAGYAHNHLTSEMVEWSYSYPGRVSMRDLSLALTSPGSVREEPVWRVVKEERWKRGRDIAQLEEFVSNLIIGQESYDLKVLLWTLEDILASQRKIDLEQSERFIKEMAVLLTSQNEKVAQISFLQPDQAHINRVVGNVTNLMKNPKIMAAMAGAFGTEKKAKGVAVMAALLSKIGFADVTPGDRTSYRLNRIKALRIINSMESEISSLLDLNPQEFDMLREAVLREGTFGIGTEDTYDDLVNSLKDARLKRREINEIMGVEGVESMKRPKYDNPLTTLLTIASEIDISRARLQPWQRKKEFIETLRDIYNDPIVVRSASAINMARIDKARLEIEIAQLQEQKKQATTAREESRIEKIIRNATRELEKMEMSIVSEKDKFRDNMKTIIQKNIEEKKDALQEAGIYGRAREYLADITHDSYLWYVSSYGIVETKVDEETGEIIVVTEENQFTKLGAAARLPHIVDFHYNRLNDTLALIRGQTAFTEEDIRLERHKHEPGEHVRRFGEVTPRADIHTHLKMSVDFDFYVWNGTIVNESISLEDPQLISFIEKSEGLLRDLSRREDITLRSYFVNARKTSQGILDFIQRYRPGYKPSANKNLMVRDAEDLLNDRSVQIDAKEREMARKQLEEYHMLQHYVRNLYNFREGALTRFCKHFMAASALLKISPEEELATLKRITKQALDNYEKDGVTYFEPRFNISDKDGTLSEVMTVIQAFKEWKEDHPDSEMDIRIITSITKFGGEDTERPDDVREREKRTNGEILVGILKNAWERIDAGKREGIDEGKYDKGITAYSERLGRDIVIVNNDPRKGIAVTPADVLQYLRGMDTAGQEEGNHPDIFFGAFAEIDGYHDWLREVRGLHGEEFNKYRIGRTTHVSESITDVSMESGIRYGLEAIYNQRLTLNENGEAVLPEDAAMDRLGHLIVPALVDYGQFRDATRSENVLERIKQIEHDLWLLELGVPLLAVSRESLERELAELEPVAESQRNVKRYQEHIRAAEKMLKKGEISEDRFRKLTKDDYAGLEAEEAKGLDYTVEYSYDTGEKIMDLQTRARFVLDNVIKHGITVETNPTSNVGISPHINDYDEHTLKTYLDYAYGDVFKSPSLIQELIERSQEQDAEGNPTARAALAQKQLDFIEGYKKEASEKKYFGMSARITINTDDLTLFETTSLEEIYRIALVMNVSPLGLLNIIQEGFRSAIGNERTAPATKADTQDWNLDNEKAMKAKFSQAQDIIDRMQGSDHMKTAEQFYRRAVEYEDLGEYISASYYYSESARFMELYLRGVNNETEEGKVQEVFARYRVEEARDSELRTVLLQVESFLTAEQMREFTGQFDNVKRRFEEMDAERRQLSEYHDFQHTMDDVRLTAQGLSMMNAGGEAVDAKDAFKTLLAALLHDVGYSRKEAQTHNHVTLSVREAEGIVKAFAEDMGLTNNDVNDVLMMIATTSVAPLDSDKEKQPEVYLLRKQAQSMRDPALIKMKNILLVADLTGAATTSRYFSMLPQLYREFHDSVESDMFGSALQLMSGTAFFQNNIAKQNILKPQMPEGVSVDDFIGEIYTEEQLKQFDTHMATSGAIGNEVYGKLKKGPAEGDSFTEAEISAIEGGIRALESRKQEFLGSNMDSINKEQDFDNMIFVLKMLTRMAEGKEVLDSAERNELENLREDPAYRCDAAIVLLYDWGRRFSDLASLITAEEEMENARKEARELLNNINELRSRSMAGYGFDWFIAKQENYLDRLDGIQTIKSRITELEAALDKGGLAQDTIRAMESELETARLNLDRLQSIRTEEYPLALEYAADLEAAQRVETPGVLAGKEHGGSLIGKLYSRDGRILTGGFSVKEEADRIEISNAGLASPVVVPIAGDVDVNARQVLNIADSYLSLEGRVTALAGMPEEDHNRAFLARLREALEGKKVVVLEPNENVMGFFGPETLYISRELLDDPLSMVHELGESMAEEHIGMIRESFPGITDIGELTMHTYMRGAGRQVRIAYDELAGEMKGRINRLNAEELIKALEGKMKEMGMREMTASEKALIRLNERGGYAGKHKGIGSRILLFGFQDHLDPAGNARLTGRIRNITGDLRRNCQNIILIPSLNIETRAPQATYGRKAGRKMRKDMGISTTVVHFDDTTLQKQLEEALAEARDNKDKFSKIFVDCISPEQLEVAKRFRDSLMPEERNMVIIGNDIIPQEQDPDEVAIDEVKVITIASAILNDNRLRVDFGLTPEKLAGSRKRMLTALADSGIIDADNIEDAKVEELEDIMQGLYSGARALKITQVNWEEIRDWYNAQEEILRSL